MKTLLLMALAVMFLAFSARAQVLVYDLSFNTTGTSVNYSFLEGGYLVVDTDAKAVTSLVIQTDPDTELLYYTTGVLAGTYKELRSEGANQEYAVISSTSGTTGNDTVAFQVIGKTTGHKNVGAGNSLSIANKLQGFLLASAPESVSTDTNGITTVTYGFAGSSRVSANYQSGLTRDANDQRLDSSNTINMLTEVLRNRGIVPQPSPSPTASPSATP